MKFRKMDEYAVIHIPRLLALTIPFLIITGAHLLNAIGIGVPGLLLDPTFGLAFIASGAIIAVFGMSVGLLPIFILLILLWASFAYIYITQVLNLT